MDERARNKRKLGEMQDNGSSDEDDEEDEDEEEEDDDTDTGKVEKEKPGQGLKKRAPESEASNKKQKVADDAEAPQQQQQLEDKKLSRAEKKALNKQKKEEKKEERRMAAETKSAKSGDGKADTGSNGPATQNTQAKTPKRNKKVDGEGLPPKDHIHPSTEEDEVDDVADNSDLERVEIPGLAEPEDNSAADSTPSSGPNSPIFDAPDSNKDSVEPASTTTSISSVVAPSEKPKHIKIPTDTTALRARLAAKIEALRAARKADVDGKPIRTRQELIEARREKQAQRKAKKQELRRQAKAEEERRREEALASARNSPGSMLSPLVDFGDDDGSANHFAFGRVAFADGTQMSHDLSYEKDGEGKKQRKGPSDPKTALAKLEAQKRRIAGLDEDKRKEVLEKETWLAARRRAEGDKVHNDESLLKKAVKRKEKAKKKSEKEWKERARGVENSIRERQRKREDNLRKRRDEKGMKGKKKGGASKKKNRPGFEGSFGGMGGKRK